MLVRLSAIASNHFIYKTAEYLLSSLFILYSLMISHSQAQPQSFILTANNQAPYAIQTEAIGNPPPDGYPVIYLLDGNRLFPLVRKVITTPAVIVAIGYPDTLDINPARRAFDYTPPSDNYQQTGDQMNTQFGGAEQFSQFIEQQLKPFIAQRYPINYKRQAILGHSYGGLFVLYQLFVHPEHYQSYFAISPSIWWNQKRLLDFFSTKGLHHKTLWLANGEYESQHTPSTDSQTRQKLNARKMLENTQALITKLQIENSGLIVDYTIFPQATHQSVVAPAIKKAIHSWENK
ncbi:alpha/beta hydrolase [Suttonella ornithocola]|uniref:Ferri-bacillibactin esterase BesA n=1 Tax=Suttonella ornithocola TaxID=279832 RepID=A0A380MLU3_9GAMM|nr:alpha/beta hydrolase-fold protein [Suttonella ornithocola]SUO93218.1 Ferri-bacillibactin esterase BesA [Suttonella ornithocola]